MRPFPPLAGSALALALALGCAQRTPRCTFEQAPGVDLSRYRTFAPDPRRELLLVSRDLRRVEVPGLRERASRELESRGYLPAQAGEAELWLEVLALAPGRREAGSRPQERGGGPGGRENGSDARGALALREHGRAAGP